MRLPVLTSLLALASLAAACSQPVAASGDWQLDAAASRLSFVSIKSGDIAEAHGFGGLSGQVDEAGLATLIIDLDTVATGIEIRDERMREHLFETDRFARAQVTTRIELAALADLDTGDRRSMRIDAVLDLHGHEVDLEADILVTDIDGQRVLVESASPLLLHAADFGLEPGLATLQDLAGLPSITPVVPVSFSLLFVRD